MAFVVDIEKMIQTVNETIDNMPPGVWEVFLNKMYKPFMKRVVAADSKKILPPKWMTALPSRRPPSSLRQNYYDLCAVLFSDKNMHGKECRETIRKILHPGIGLLTGLLKRDVNNKEFQTVFMGLNAQLQMMNGQYSVYFFVKNHLRDFDTVDFLMVYILQCGSAEFILHAVRRYSAVSKPSDHYASDDEDVKPELIYTPRAHTLQALIAALETHIDEQDQRRAAVAMALHHRLGSGAGLGSLGVDLLSAMAPTDPPKMVTWDDIFGQVLGFEIA
jgi:hypothetical protein